MHAVIRQIAKRPEVLVRESAKVGAADLRFLKVSGNRELV